jgi:hypothetical protein
VVDAAATTSVVAAIAIPVTSPYGSYDLNTMSTLAISGSTVLLASRLVQIATAGPAARTEALRRLSEQP